MGAMTELRMDDSYPEGIERLTGSLRLSSATAMWKCLNARGQRNLGVGGARGVIRGSQGPAGSEGGQGAHDYLSVKEFKEIVHQERLLNRLLGRLENWAAVFYPGVPSP